MPITFVVERIDPASILHPGRHYHVAFHDLDGPVAYKVCRLKRGSDGKLWVERRSTRRGNVPVNGDAMTVPEVAGIIVGRFIFEE